MNEDITFSIKQTLGSLEADENMVVLSAVESGTGRGDLTLLRRTGPR
jgi:hypothetical protein